MFSILRKGCLSAFVTLLSLSAMNSSAIAWEPHDSYDYDSYDYGSCDCACESNKFYIGLFGGGLRSDSTAMSQLGTAYFPEIAGGPLAVVAKGHTKGTSSGFIGAQVGYEWLQCPLFSGCSGWTITPAVELEAYFYRHNKKGHLFNNTAPDRLPEHDFADSFHMRTGVGLVNAVFSLNNPCLCGFSPYIGGGIGAARVSVRNAKSLQVAPVELGVNHFNSQKNDSDWTFAAQAKIGLRYKFSECFNIFAEYRYLYLDSCHYVLGSTVYPTHVPTSPWNVKVKNIHYNAFAVGVQLEL